MSDNQLTALEQYKEYYSIPDVVPMNVLPIPEQQTIPNWDAFEQEIPDVFRLASELHTTDSAAIVALRHLGDIAEMIVQVLQQQNAKLNLLLGYVLRNEDNPEFRQHSIEFGGGGVRYIDNETLLKVGQQTQLKLFLHKAAHNSTAAIYSYAEVANIETTPQGQAITLAFSRIRDDDREIMVRASLHAQSRLLKKRAEERDK